MLLTTLHKMLGQDVSLLGHHNNSHENPFC